MLQWDMTKTKVVRIPVDILDRIESKGMSVAEYIVQLEQGLAGLVNGKEASKPCPHCPVLQARVFDLQGQLKRASVTQGKSKRDLIREALESGRCEAWQLED